MAFARRPATKRHTGCSSSSSGDVGGRSNRSRRSSFARRSQIGCGFLATLALFVRFGLSDGHLLLECRHRLLLELQVAELLVARRAREGRSLLVERASCRCLLLLVLDLQLLLFEHQLLLLEYVLLLLHALSVLGVLSEIVGVSECGRFHREHAYLARCLTRSFAAMLLLMLMLMLLVLLRCRHVF